MALDKTEVIQILCGEIALITRKDTAEVNAEASLRDNGIDSMSFIEVLLFIKSEWGIDYLDRGLPSDAQNSVSALAEHICNNQGA